MKASLRTKFIIFITLAIVVFDFVFLLTSVNLYNRDKESYVYENVFNSNRTVTQLLNKHLDQIRLLSYLDFLETKDLKLPATLAIENIFIFDLKQKKYIYQLHATSLPQVHPETSLQEYLRKVEDEVQLSLTSEGLMLTYWRSLSPERVLKMTSNVSNFVQNFQQKGLYSVLFFDRLGQLVFNIKSDSTGDILKIKNMDEILPSNIQEGARDLSFQGQQFIMSFSETSDKLLKVVTLIPRSAAFTATQNLIYQNIALAVIFIGISIVVILFAAKLITNPLGELTRVAQSAGQGQYDHELKATTKDEIGILIRAFNKMFADIKKYTDELKDKYRIENEIKVAKRVQEQYIPKEDYKNQHVDIAGFYVPATECSGDWWNYRIHEGKTYLFISDVTGHGLPSALLTSAVNSCCSAIDNQIKRTGTFVKPSEILKVINDVIYQSSNELMLTMCVALIDHEQKKIIFSNASHEFPVLMNEKKGMTPLLAVPGYRLGENAVSEYEDTEIAFESSDVLFMYTDGLVENPNTEGKALGDRQLLRYLKKCQGDTRSLRDQLQDTYLQFVKSAKIKDDVTFFFAKLH